MKKVLLPGILFSIFSCADAQETNWHPQKLSQVDSLLQKESKKIFLLTEAEWCKYCNQMKSEILSDSVLLDLLQKKYHSFFFDVESTKKQTFFRKDYHFRPSGKGTGSHEFADHLEQLSEKKGVPGIFIFQPNGQLLFSYSGYLSAKDLIQLLKTIP